MAYRIFVMIACISFIVAGLISSVKSGNHALGIASILIGIANYLLLYH